MSRMTRREAWLKAARELESIGQSCRFEAELLLRGALGGESRARFFAALEDEVPAQALEQYADWVTQRLQGVPTQYLLGEQEFMGLRFGVSPAVLIPRPDTEILVESTLSFAQSLEQPLVADIATGSGAIAVALAAICRTATVYATDISTAALDVARQNAETNQVADRIHFRQGDLAGPLLAEGVRLHCLVSNPPYIPTGDLPSLSAEVRSEPTLALDGGTDGLLYYRRLLPQAWELLLPGGLLAFEVGKGQAAAVADMTARQGFAEVELHKDLAGIDRVVCARREAK